MAEKEEKGLKREEKKSHKEVHTDKRSSKYRKLIEHYKRRNKLIEAIIACVVIVLVFLLLCNRTFLKTEYSMKVNNSEITIPLPRFTYYVGSDGSKVIFKTLRKSTNTRQFFDDFLNTETFDIYYCGGKKDPYYYNEENKYFISSIEVKKGFAIKTITVNYSTVDKDLFCNTIETNDVVNEDEL